GEVQGVETLIAVDEAGDGAAAGVDKRVVQRAAVQAFELREGYARRHAAVGERAAAGRGHVPQIDEVRRDEGVVAADAGREVGRRRRQHRGVRELPEDGRGARRLQADVKRDGVARANVDRLLHEQ